MTTVPQEAVKAADIIQVITDLRLAILQDDDEGLAEHAEPMIKAKELISKLSALPHLPGVGVKELEVVYDNLLNELGWDLNDFLIRSGAQFDGRTFNHMKPFIRDCIQKWVDANATALEPSAARSLALEEEEAAIDALRLKAFKTNNDFDKRAYFDAVSKWFQDRHYRRMDAERSLSSPDHADAGKVEGEGWLPIESAPEDGTVILVYRDDAGVFTAHYVEEDAHLSSPLNPPEGDFYWFSTCGDDLTGDMPTHWRPLPSAPSQEVAGS